MKHAKDPYSLLGLGPTASLEEVKRAYRRLAMRWHPDRNPSAAAESEFKRIRAAYELILDPQRYAQWQQEAASGKAAPDEAAVSPSPAEDHFQTLVLSLEEAAQGCVKPIELVRSSRCTPCHGSGRVKLNHSVFCSLCKGVGSLRSAGRGTRTCDGCDGRGYLREADCEECSGSGWRKKSRTLSVKVPPGIVQGERLRLARQARNGPEGEAAAGDLYLEIRLAPHPLFELQERELHCRVPVSIFRLLCGGELAVPTVNGSTLLELQPYPEHGLDYCCAGQGFPKKHGRGASDLFVHLCPVYPQQLGAKERALLERLEHSVNADPKLRAAELGAWIALMEERAGR